jgi:hypothetical protein
MIVATTIVAGLILLFERKGLKKVKDSTKPTVLN